MFNHTRLSLARMRRRLTNKGLAEKAGVSALTITRLEKGKNEPDEETVAKLAAALGYPPEFFYGDDLDVMRPDAVSFRSLSKMTARERNWEAPLPVRGDVLTPAPVRLSGAAAWVAA